MNEIICGIYQIENVTNHKKYIGKSIDIYKRWKDHKFLLNSNLHHNNHLQFSWNKYGEDLFEFSIVEVCNVADLNDKEKYYIMLFHTYDGRFGYNLTFGGDGEIPTQDTRQKMSISHIGLLGTEESKRKQSEKLSGKNNPMYGRYGERSPVYGRKQSQYEIQKMINTRWTEDKRKEQSINVQGKNNPMYGRYGSKNPASRRVMCIETGEIFETISLAAKWCGLKSQQMIGQVCLGKRKTAGTHPITGVKLHWKYVDDITNHFENNELAM